MSDKSEIIDDNLNSDSTKDNYDVTNKFDEGYSLKRITFKSLMAFVLSVLNFEKGILFTVKELIIRPKTVIEEYLKKDRKKLVNPIRFLVFSTAISTFLMFNFMHQENLGEVNFGNQLKVGFDMSVDESNRKDSIAEVTNLQDSLKTSLDNKRVKRQRAQEAMGELGKLLSQSNDKFTFALIFFFALTSLWLFKNSGYNYTEHLVVNSYAISILNVLNIIAFIPAIAFGSTSIVIVSSILSFIYVLYYWMQIYNKNSIGGFFRCLLNYIFGYFLFMIAMIIFVIGYLVIKAGI